MTDHEEPEQEAEFDAAPPLTDYHGNKRELLKRGLAAGKLSMKEIRASLPEEHMSDAELDIFLFTCKNLGIEVT